MKNSEGVNNNNTNKWCFHNPESVMEYEMHKVLWDFYIPIDHPIWAGQPDVVIVNNNNKKENLLNSGLWNLGESQSKIKFEKRDKYLDFARELKI